ncbi:hypothetical protein CHUAL_009991 [Chamberlinius hualienensis]
MLDIFRGLKNLLKVNRIHIDGSVFRLHYHITVIILISFSLIVTTRQYVGNPIECIHSKDVTENMVNTFCWIHSTYTIPKAYHKKVGTEIPYPGIDRAPEMSDRKYHKYYQWVCFMLFFQAVLFYIPRWLWKNWESGKIEALMMGLHLGVFTEAEKKFKKKLLMDYLWDNRCNHNWWAVRYFLCEFLSLTNVVGQLFLMDRFFEGEFLTYGIKVIQFSESDQDDRNDPMLFIFPRITKCHFHKYGASGEVEKHDAICVLPLNIVNEKIYIFLWFWFIILLILTAMVLIFRVVIFCCVRMRVFLLYVRFRIIPRDQINELVKRTEIGDWFLFYMLGQNVDTLIFKDIIVDLAKRLAQHGKEPTV